MYSKSQIWINFKELQAEKCTGKKTLPSREAT
jgi:hypothetical protein